MQRTFLAIDIGASSGRHIIGTETDSGFQTEEVYRFPNGMKRENGHLIWDIDELLRQVVEGIRQAFLRYPHIDSLSIDTWAVDYVLLKDGKPIYPCYAYRDERTQTVIGDVHRIVPFETLYQHTGIQFQPFNTVYQIYADMQSGRLAQADELLMLPEYLLYRLCGVKKREYTNATSTGLVNARTQDFDSGLIDALGLPMRFFPALTKPGEVLGSLTDDISQMVGGQTKVVLCATHDTASAVEGIPMQENAPFLSSGTWSLLGVKLPQPITTKESMACNFTNEGGVGYIRFLKNIMGLWMIQCIQKQLGISFPEMVELARNSSYSQTFDVNDPRFIAPEDMIAEVRAALDQKPVTNGDLIRSVYVSLAEGYGKAVREMEDITGRKWKKLYIAGGGAKNHLLNELTAQYTGKEVIALPIEATALGNLKIQRSLK